MLRGGEADGAPARAGVFHHIRQRLAREAVGGDLHRGGEGRQPVGGLHGDAQASAIAAGGDLAQGADEAEVVERGRAQRVDQAADVRDR